MKLYYGIISAIVGSLLLILSYFLDWVDYNFVQILAALLIIGGIIAHIFLNKKKSETPKEYQD